MVLLLRLFNGICFHFHLCVTEIPAYTCVPAGYIYMHGALSVTALINLQVTLIFDLFTSIYVQGLPV